MYVNGTVTKSFVFGPIQRQFHKNEKRLWSEEEVL